MADHFQVHVTVPTAEEAARLTRSVVERRLAASGQISGPITSTFWWRGTIESAPEWTCVFKTTGPRLGVLMDTVRAEHSYEVPEIVATRIDTGDPDFLAWLEQETAPRHPPGR
jgi:periplasmic divalent cation tolerance protein